MIDAMKHHGIEERFIDGSREEAKKILDKELNGNPHIAHLNNLLESGDVGEIAEYGMSKIGAYEDHNLASYFFVISNLKIFSPLARDFFTDVMVYCEDQVGPLKTVATIREKYDKEIRPTL